MFKNLQCLKGLLAGSLCIAVVIASGTLSAEENPVWDEAMRTLEFADKMVAKGNQNLLEGRKMIRDGSSKIMLANDVMRQNREQYQSLLANAEPTQETALAIEALAKLMDENIADIATANNLISEGNALVTKGQKQIRDGRVGLESGSKKLKQSKRAIKLRLMLPETSALEN